MSGKRTKQLKRAFVRLMDQPSKDGRDKIQRILTAGVKPQRGCGVVSLFRQFKRGRHLEAGIRPRHRAARLAMRRAA